MVRPSGNRTARTIRLVRLTRLLLHFGRGAVTMAVVFPFVDRSRQQRHIQSWSRKLLDILRVRLHGGGLDRFPPRTLIVANHVSWLDIWLLHSVSAVCFVAKSEIREWPLIGWMAARARTLFIERERKRDTHRIAGVIADALSAQEAVAIFPESTTTDGLTVKPFRASLVRPAVDLNAPVMAVAIRYLNADGSINTQIAYADDTTLMQSLRSILAHPEVHAEVIDLGVIEVGDKTRRVIALEAEQRVREAVMVSPAEAQRLPTMLP